MKMKLITIDSLCLLIILFCFYLIFDSLFSKEKPMSFFMSKDEREIELAKDLKWRKDIKKLYGEEGVQKEDESYRDFSIRMQRLVFKEELRELREKEQE